MTTESSTPGPVGSPVDRGVGRLVNEGTQASRERPILFSAPMVRALLDGGKTQTRRIMKPQPRRVDGGVPFGDAPAWAHAEPGSAVMRCPYGQRGDRLWVRETHMDLGACFLYRADANAEQERAIVAPGQRWKPAIHMPRVACRLTLVVTGVRVERLQDISRGDAMAEGCPFPNMARGDDPRVWYEDLWCDLNGADSWRTNPWVWVVEFRKTPNVI